MSSSETFKKAEYIYMKYIMYDIIGVSIQDVSAGVPGCAVRHQDFEVGGGRAPVVGAAAGRRRGHLRVLSVPRRTIQHTA